jgi:hypothetical protein
VVAAIHAVQARFAQKEIKLPAARERGRGQHRAAHAAPQVAAQRAARQDGAGVRLDDDEVAVGLQREPFGVGHEGLRFTLGRLLQQQLCRGVHRFEPGRERADLRIELRQAPCLVGLVAHLAAQRLGDGAQAFQKARRVVRELAQRLVQRPGQHAARHAHARRAPGAVLGLERLAVQVHHQARQVLQVLAQLAGVARDVGHLGHLHQRADAQRAAGEPVDPGEAAQVRAAGELVERGGGQVVRLVQHQQAVVQLGQHARAQDDSSRSWLATITCAPTSALRWS